MPCSALIEPRIILDDVVDRQLHLVPFAQRRRHRRPGGALKLKCRLPSPIWPKLIGPRAGEFRHHGRGGFLDESGDGGHRHGNIVLDRSAFALFGFRHAFAHMPEAAGLRLVLRHGGIGRQGRRPWRLPAPTAISASRLAPAPPDTSISTYQGEACGQGIAGAGNMLQHQFQGRARDTARMPRAGRRSWPAYGPEACSAAAGEGTAVKAVTICAGRGNSRAAAVTIPSVPSAPMKICFRS